MSSFTVLFLTLLCANLLLQVENKSVFGIGTRIIGDQLLMKDVLQTPPIRLTDEPVIKFNYAIKEPITYIEIVSDQNIYANVNFSYEHELVEGSVSAMYGPSKPTPFDVLIQIYGLNETFLNVNPAYILNKDQQFNGVLQPDYHLDHEAFSLMQQDIKDLDDLEEYDESQGNDENQGDDLDVNTENDFDENYDKIIEQGKRQEGDFLVFETTQISSNTTEDETQHSVTFYFIDIYFITCLNFTIFEHFADNAIDNYVPPLVEFGHISPTTFKAVITDYNTKALFAQIKVYGYHPTAVPVAYEPFLSNGQTAPMSSLKQLKLLMNAQQRQASPKQETITNNGGPQTQPNELGQQTESPPNSNGNTAVNCWQQVQPAHKNAAAHRYGGDVAIFNVILTIVLTMIFI